MNDKRPCPLFKGADVEVQIMCHRCGHHNTETTACEQPLNKALVKRGHLTQKEYEALHSMMGLEG